MSSRSFRTALVGLAMAPMLFGGVPGAGASAVQAVGSAIEVPGIATLNVDRIAEVNSVSCPSAGNCVAGGDYRDGSFASRAFVSDEVNGTWNPAVEVTGAVAEQVNSVSCGSVGNCVAGGPSFLDAEVNGTWQPAFAVPVTGGQSPGGDVTSVSCPSAGNCAAVGVYNDSSGHVQVFAIVEVNGTWRKAIELPGIAALNVGGLAAVYSVSCASAGSCAASGRYVDASARYQVFVATEVNGTWQPAIKIPGTASVNTARNSTDVTSRVSCGSPGNCTAAATYLDGTGFWHSFVASEVNGAWQPAVQLPGALGGDAFINSVSCASAGNCAAGGYYTGPRGGSSFALVAAEVNGTWQPDMEVPGTTAGVVNSVSCRSAGNCLAGGGGLVTASGRDEVFVADEIHGTWHPAFEVPGIGALGVGPQLHSLSCPSVGSCVAGGFYYDRSARAQEAFVTSP